jgi:hypothetical protein
MNKNMIQLLDNDKDAKTEVLDLAGMIWYIKLFIKVDVDREWKTR